jgi:hypothetical protein
MRRITQRLHLMVLVLIVGTSGVLWGAAPPRWIDPTAVRQHIRHLGDRDYLVRQQAQRQLLQYGPQVLPQLTPHLNSPEWETRRRLVQVIQQLEQERDLAPRRVTATFRNAPLEQVFAKVEWQTGLKTKWAAEDGQKAPRFTGSFRNATYWEVMEQLAQQTKSTIQPTTELINRETEQVEMVTGLVPAKRAVRFSFAHEAFRVEASRISTHGERNLLEDDDPEVTQPGVLVTLQLRCETRLSIVDVGLPRLRIAQDDRGRSLVPVAAPESSEDDRPGGGRVLLPPVVRLGLRGVAPVPVTGGNAQVETMLALDRPHPEARRIARLTGVIPAQVIAGYRVRPILKDIKRGASFEVLGQKQEISNLWVVGRGKGVQLQIRGTGAAMPMNDDENVVDIGTLSMLLEFRDEDGLVCPSELTPSLFAGLLLQVMPSATGKRPSQAVLREPLTRSVEIPFEFRDIPLP